VAKIEKDVAAEQAAPEVKVEERVTEGFMNRVKLSTKQQLDAQPKHTIRLPNAKKNDPNYEIVGVNGYNYQIKRGESVQVPETVFNILVEAELI
jgi:hypothetical protein